MIQHLIINVILMIKVISAIGVPTLKLNNGLNIPIIGYGTFQATEQGIRDAIANGYRHIDTSYHYDSEIYLGNVLKEVFKEGKIKRSDMFIVSKLESDSHERSQVSEVIKKSLARIGIDYLDLYLIHNPIPVTIDLTDTWLGMMDVLKANLTKSIGVSNFNQQQIDHIIANGTHVIPVTNQVYSNPYHSQKALLDYLKARGITLTAWRPLDPLESDLLSDPVLVEVSKKYNVTTAQVVLRFQIQRGVIVIPKANSLSHIKENIDLFGFSLSEEDMKTIDSLDKSS